MINLKDGKGVKMGDLTCLEGLMKVERILELGVKPGIFGSPQASRLQSSSAC
jgi:hypothetical protein